MLLLPVGGALQILVPPLTLIEPPAETEAVPDPPLAAPLIPPSSICKTFSVDPAPVTVAVPIAPVPTPRSAA
jgi:hypothetical protein